MKTGKRLIQVLLSSLLVLTAIPVVLDATSEPVLKISAGSTMVPPGGSASVAITVSDNPGFCSLRTFISYPDDVLEWTGYSFDNGIVAEAAEEGKAYVSMFQPPEEEGEDKNPIVLFVEGELGEKDASVESFGDTEGVLATLTFKVRDDAPEGEYEIILSSSDADDVLAYDAKTTEAIVDIPFELVEGSVKVGTYLPGDVNVDSNVDIDDVVLLLQYSLLPDLYPVSYPGSLDFTKDGVIDIDDVVLLLQYSLLPDLYPIE